MQPDRSATADEVHMARGQIGLAIRRLAGKYPFHAKVLERFVIQPRASVGTMAVAPAGDDVQLLFCPRFVLRITLPELVGVLVHEVHHVVFGHLCQNPADYPDTWARTVAEEVTVNEFVAEPLPGRPILLRDFPGLPPMESTFQRYRRLARAVHRPELASLAEQFAAEDCEPVNGDTTGDRSPDEAPRGPLTIVDDHGPWQEEGEDPGGTAAAVREILQDAAIEVGTASVPECLREALNRLGIGTTTGSLEERLDGTGGGQLDWITLLRRYIGRARVARPDYLRPPRRVPEHVGILPGRSRAASLPRVMAVIDTSASLGPGLLGLISVELGRLARRFHVTVVECDTKVQRVYRYRRITGVHGRGGTDLRPPFNTTFLQRHRPDLIVYFTDGDGPAPGNPPRTPTVWCLTPEGNRPASWGRLIRMMATAAPRRA